MSQSENITAEHRRDDIQQLIQDHQTVSIPALAAKFGVSEMTIRRDLDKLQQSGRIRRTHGGAVVAERMAFEFDFVARRNANRRQKQAIAAEALKLIKPGHRIIIDTGTTTLELAHLLKDFHDITVITPSLAAASELQFSEGVQTVLLGGVIRKGSPDLTGMVAEAVLDMFAADIAFQGADGIGTDGALYNADMRISKVDQKIRSRAERTYILADSTKIGKSALVKHGFIQQVDGLITDDRIDPENLSQLKKLGANVIVAASN